MLEDSLHLNAGAIRSVSTGSDAILELGGLDHDAAHKVSWRLSPTRSTPVVSQAIVDAAVLTLTFETIPDTRLTGETNGADSRTLSR